MRVAPVEEIAGWKATSRPIAAAISQTASA